MTDIDRELEERQLAFDKVQEYNSHLLGRVSDIYFEKSIPVPRVNKRVNCKGPSLHNETQNFIDAFKYMKPGESFTMHNDKVYYIRKAAEKAGVEVVIKSWEPGKVRVWLIDNKIKEEIETHYKLTKDPQTYAMLVGDKEAWKEVIKRTRGNRRKLSQVES